MKLPLYLARRFRRNKSANRYLSFITWSSSVGIGMGTAVMIILLSVMNGFERALEDELLAVVPHAEFEAVQGSLNNWQQVADTAMSHSNVVAAAPVVRFTGLVQRQRKFHGIQIRAISPHLEQQVSSLQNYVDQSSWSRFIDNETSILLGQGLATELGVVAGDSIQIMVPELAGSNSFGGPARAPKRFSIEVAGVFEFGGEIDFRTAIIHLSKGQEVTELGEGVNAVRLKLANVFAAPVTVSEIGFQLDEYAYMHDWTRTEGHLYRDIELVKTVMYVVLLLVMAVASFNIVATLMMQVEEKRAAIAILKTMGTPDRTVLQTFVWQGALSGIPGAFVGAVVGVFGASALPKLMSAIESAMGAPVLPADIYFVSQIPVSVVWHDVIFVVFVAIVTSLLATLYPAKKAAQIAPAQALRNT